MIRRMVLLVACLVFSMPAVSYGTQITNSKNEFLCRVDPKDPERVLVEVLGTMSLQLGTDDIVGNAMACFLKLWPTYGIVAEGLPNAFLIVMEENPQVFFAVMSKNPAIFRQWLEELPGLSFAWGKNPPCLLEPRRKQLISVLEHTKMREPRLKSLNEQVIHKLSSIRCRQIQ